MRNLRSTERAEFCADRALAQCACNYDPLFTSHSDCACISKRRSMGVRFEISFFLDSSGSSRNLLLPRGLMHDIPSRDRQLFTYYICKVNNCPLLVQNVDIKCFQQSERQEHGTAMQLKKLKNWRSQQKSRLSALVGIIVAVLQRSLVLIN